MTDFDHGAADPELPAPAPNDRYRPGVTVELTAVECRVVGSLIEKAALTPDLYPMTTNALVAACNQKTNRHPVVEYSAVQIDAALLELRQRNLVRRVHTPGSRATKHRQTLDEVLDLDAGELALVSVLMLRGPQTVGELRLRTERQHNFNDLGSVEACLDRLAARQQPVVRQLVRQPGHKESRWQHLLEDAAATQAQASNQSFGQDESVTDAASQAPWGRSSERSVVATKSPVSDALETRVAQLEADVVELRGQLTTLAAQLGETLE